MTDAPAKPPAPAPAPAPDPARSLQELRPLHVALLQQWAELDEAEQLRRGEAFRQAAAAAGRWIKNLEERDSVQGLIDYWTATMANLPAFEVYPKLVTVAAFDERTVKSIRKPSPFVGLNPFHLADRNRFHGRVSACETVLAAVRAHGLVVVAGPSGLGKSSLAQAGAAARLDEEPLWSALPAVSPGRYPVSSLLRAMQPAHAEAGWIEENRLLLVSDPGHLRALAEQKLEPDVGAVLVIDRAEELFTYDVASPDLLLTAAALGALAAAPARHRVILTIREEYFEQLAALLKTAKLELPEAAIVQPPPATAEEMKEAIVKPAEAVGLTFEPALVDALVADLAGQADALPLLEFTLTRLRDDAEIDRIGLADYLALGKADLTIQDAGERALAALEPGAREAARVAFLELVTIGRYPSRRRLRRDELRRAVAKNDVDGSDLNAALAGFSGVGLLRRLPGEDAGDDRFEIAHESVVRNWPRLLVWLQDRRRGDETRERLMIALERWRAAGRPGNQLLSGNALREAADYLGTSAALDEYVIAGRKRRRRRLTIAGIVLLLVLAWSVLWAVRTLDAEHTASRAATIAEIAADRTRALNARASARSRAIVDIAIGRDFQRRAMMADQVLMALVTKSTIPENAVPRPFLDRMHEPVGPLPGGRLGFDPNFLVETGGRNLAVPLPRLASADIETLVYPNVTVFYDHTRQVPLLVMSNYDRTAKPMPPFPGIGVFPDGRVRGAQIGARFSPAPDKGLVPVISFQEAAWMTGDSSSNASFMHYAPLTVLQPWDFYQGPWLGIETELLSIIDADRITYLTGPIVTAGDRQFGGILMPRSYFKIAIYRDSVTGRRMIEGRMIGIDARRDGTSAKTSLARIVELVRRGGIDLGPLNLVPSE
ncbi:MAG: hypothetical protein QOD42_3150 [Sphingomonadales bacterium]|jgi:type II secretory pathway component PulM|nr:hypothetical protein [Sphingomonadales bacterium]